MATRLQDQYDAELKPALKEEFGYKSDYQVPRLEKIVLNIGVGEAAQDSKKMGFAVADMALIAGQKPIVIKARRSVAAFKLREGMSVGCKVTLRRDRMYEFLDRLINIALPRVRDFRGLRDTSFDGRGNYALGLKEQIVFPEIDYDKIDEIRGMDVVIVTSAQSDDRSEGAAQGLQHAVFQLSDTGQTDMAKKSAVERNKMRGRLVARYAAKRARLKAIAEDMDSLPAEDRFAARISSCPRCRAIPQRCASATAATSRGGRAATIASSACRALPSGTWPRAARSPAWSRRAGRRAIA